MGLLRKGLLAFASSAIFVGPATAVAGPVGDPNNPELSSRLARVAAPPASTASPGQQSQAVGLPASGPGSLMRRGRDLVVAVRVSGDANDRADDVRAAGGDVLDVSPRYATITAAIAATRLRDLAGRPGVEAVTEVLQPQLSGCPQGDKVSEGDTQLLAATGRSAFGVSGLGVTVGVLSDSYNQDASAPTTAPGDVASGDLPGATNPCGHTTAVNVLQEGPANGEDEGRAMAQIVHDIAPGAKLSFASAFISEIAFANNIRNLATAGAKVIVDDVTYFDEPMFQDGPVAVAVNDVTAQGVTYFSSAGNNNVLSGAADIGSWEAPAFRNSGSCPTGSPGYATQCMDFDPGAGVDNTLSYSVAAGKTLTLDLQWAQPHFGVTTDIDGYLLNASNAVVDSSEDTNLTTQKPFEFLNWTNTAGATATVRLAINRYTGAGGGDSATPRVKVVMLENGASGVVPTEYTASSGGDVVGPTIFGHNGAGNAVSTAAVPYNNSAVPETYSSRGPVTQYFGPVSGTSPAPALGAPAVLAKPDLAATDCGANTFFGFLDGATWRFCGTSAAAPHAAGVAALQRELSPTATNAQVKQALIASGRPVGAFGATAVGSGLIDANAAVGATPLTQPAADTDPATSIGANGATLNSTINPHGIATAYKYEYGTTTSFGTVIGPFSAGSGAAPVAQPQAITGLAPNTTYYYRVAARHGTNPQTLGQVRALTTGGGPSAPAAVTGAASSITGTGASLAGTVNAHGQSTAYTFEYGTSTSFGSISTVQSAGSSTADLAVSANLSGLSPGTTYYYRLVASNATGTTNGAAGSFTTTGSTAPEVTTGAASAITTTSATLSGTLNPKGSFTSFTFEYGTTTTFGSITAVDGMLATPTIAQPVSKPVTGLSPNTTYLYRLVATNAVGTTNGTVMSFKTASV
jgi:hypothetical protein